jgi:hypothetical protein
MWLVRTAFTVPVLVLLSAVRMGRTLPGKAGKDARLLISQSLSMGNPQAVIRHHPS